MFLKGLVGDVLVTLATVYAPNDRQDAFLQNTLLDFTEGHLILGGDFNVPLVPTVDTSSGTSSLRPSVHKNISRALHNAQLIDIWTYGDSTIQEKGTTRSSPLPTKHTLI